MLASPELATYGAGNLKAVAFPHPITPHRPKQLWGRKFINPLQHHMVRSLSKEGKILYLGVVSPCHQHSGKAPAAFASYGYASPLVYHVQKGRRNTKLSILLLSICLLSNIRIYFNWIIVLPQDPFHLISLTQGLPFEKEKELLWLNINRAFLWSI